MSREYEFIVEVTMANSSKRQIILDTSVSYPFSKNYQDHFLITNKSIKIEALRSKKIELDSIFFNYTSALNRQITKALTFYYCALGEAHKIKSMKVGRYLNGQVQEEKLITQTDLNQIVEKNSDLRTLTKLDKTELLTLLEETDKGHAILIAATHLVKACCFSNAFEQFDRLWKSFNALYKQKTQLQRDAACLVEMRNHMDINQNLYPLSLAEVSHLSAQQIRNKIRWRAMLLNDFPTQKKSLDLKSFILRVTDSRFISIIVDSLPLRDSYLKAEGHYQTVDAHLKNQIKSPLKNDMDVLAILSLRYMYFVRNKTFHAEKLDSAFNIIPNSKEEQELVWSVNILRMLVIDIINFNSKF